MDKKYQGNQHKKASFGKIKNTTKIKINCSRVCLKKETPHCNRPQFNRPHIYSRASKSNEIFIKLIFAIFMKTTPIGDISASPVLRIPKTWNTSGQKIPPFAALVHLWSINFKFYLKKRKTGSETLMLPVQVSKSIPQHQSFILLSCWWSTPFCVAWPSNVLGFFIFGLLLVLKILAFGIFFFVTCPCPKIGHDLQKVWPCPKKMLPLVQLL